MAARIYDISYVVPLLTSVMRLVVASGKEFIMYVDINKGRKVSERRAL